MPQNPTHAAPKPAIWKLGNQQLGFIQVGVQQPSQPTDTVTIITVTQNSVSAKFNTLAGNNPNANANTLFLWQTGQPSIPWGPPGTPNPPYGKGLIAATGSNAAGFVTGVNISQSGYIIGYAVGSTVGNIVATSWVPDTTPSPPPGSTTDFYSTLSLYNPPSSYEVSLLYSLPPGSQPQTNNHWVGVYTGSYVTFGTFPDAAVAPIPSNNANTSVTFGPTSPLTAGASYTAAYFAGGYNSTTPSSSKVNSMCMLCTFVVPNS